MTVRYRAAGSPGWRAAMPLFRVHPESVVGRTVPEQFAGTIFDLVPGRTYEIELHATDPDGPVDETIIVAGTTRSVPGDPVAASPKSVATAADLRAALAAAQPGDVITLADGIYAGSFVITASGTASNPIVLRGTSGEGTILDGQGCASCNVLESYGSFVHVERLTLRHASRALRFQGAGTEGNVVRRVHMKDVRLGIGSNPDQRDFYLCDNILEGRLLWPRVYSDDGGAHSDDDGIRVQGDGHVVCHNQISGFGDTLKVEQDGARADDFYGNEVLSAYDNGVELDTSEGNTRCFRNRFTNTYATISFQPIFGGPAYAIRNVVVNVANEQLKFHGLGATPPIEPSGMLVLHNTFVSPALALNLQTTATSRHFLVANNLFVGPAPPGTRVTDWTGRIDDGTFDHNGWFPNGAFGFGAAGTWASFAAMQAAGTLEPHGVLLVPPTFASGLVPPSTYAVTMGPEDARLDPASNAVDRGMIVPNVTDDFTGAGPDLGALEVGCPVPLYGVRPDGIDETNEPFGCGGPTVTTTTSVPPPTTTTTTMPPCGSAPRAGCQTAASAKGILVLGDRALSWRWASGATVAKEDFGVPTTTIDYRLCLYDASGRQLDALAPAGGVCGRRACWTEGARGFVYVDGERTPGGLQRVVLTSGDGSRARIRVKGRGDNLEPVALPLVTPVRIQLTRSGSDRCWEATYGSAITNRPGAFRARPD